MHVICMDTEPTARDCFARMAEECAEVSTLQLFSTPGEVLAWAARKPVDVAFLAADIPGVNGIGLARELQQLVEGIRIVFIAADGRWALEAWDVHASGYMLRPCTLQQISRELDQCGYHPLPSQRVVIQTIPTFAVIVHGVPLHIAGGKPRELLALLVEFGSRGITTGEGIAYLWPEKANDATARSLFRMTFKRLADALEAAGAGGLVESRDNRRFLHTEKVECDLYRILSGDEKAKKKYMGQYMQEYSWAEERNAQLYRMLMP